MNMFHVHIFLVGGVGNVSSIDMSTIIIIITNGYIVMSWQLFIDGCMCCYVGRKVYIDIAEFPYMCISDIFTFICNTLYNFNKCQVP